MLVTLTRGQNAFTDLLDPSTEVAEIQTGFGFLEGPVSDAAGNVYFSDIPASEIQRWNLDGSITLFASNSGGANGLYFDRDGLLHACQGTGRSLSSVSADGEFTIIADSYDGNLLNSPNDLWIDPDNGIFFTDPRYGNANNVEQDGYHVYYISPDRTTVTRVIDDLTRPNGIIGTPDGSVLYVADHGDGKTFRYNLETPGTPTGKTEFINEGSDGLALDENGNLYLTSGGVLVYDSTGTSLGEIDFPQDPANVIFGGAEGMTLFVTARTGFYSIEMKVKGVTTNFTSTVKIKPANSSPRGQLGPGIWTPGNSVRVGYLDAFWNLSGQKILPAPSSGL